MKNNYLLFLVFLLGNITLVNAQLDPCPLTWTGVGNVVLSTVTDDADNGDGLNDGALYVDGLTAVTGQGVTLAVGGTMTDGELITFSTWTYNRNNSFVRFDVQLFNLTDGTVLATSEVGMSGGTSNLKTLTYTATATDAGDELQIRYIRNFDGNTSRNFAIDNIDLNGITCAALPVELIDFSVKKTEKGNQLDWKTGIEINNEGFEIQKSSDASSWTSIDFVRGSGSSNEGQSYQFTEENPNNGKSYYRLKQLDFDGKFEFSDIVSVNWSDKIDTFEAFPNPIHNVLNLDFSNPAEIENISIHNANGSVIWSAKNAVEQISTETFPSGIYSLLIKTNTTTTVLKIVKQ